MEEKVLIKGGTVVSGDTEQIADVAIEGGRIVGIGTFNSTNFGRTLDAEGLHVLPGVIDTQVHFREPGLTHKEDLESGTRAAICGGVTTIFEMPNTNPLTDSEDALADKLRRADGRSWCNYSFFVGATKDNVDRLGEYEKLPGSPGIKIFMGSSTGPLLVADDATLERVLANGFHRVSIHAEDEARLVARKESDLPRDHAREHPNLRDAEAARLATERIIALANKTGRPIHILHVSTKEELPLLAAAKAAGQDVTCEVTPQHLYFAAPDCYDRLGSYAQMNPPIRSEDHRAVLREAVKQGLFDVIGSDHAPHTVDEKAKPYPNSPSGMPGVQTLLPVMLNFVNSSLLDLKKLVRMTSQRPAKLFGIKDRGRLEIGQYADLAIVDLQAKRTVEQHWLESKCGWSPYVGESLTGWPVHVLMNGIIQVEDAGLVGRPAGIPVEFDWKS